MSSDNVVISFLRAIIPQTPVILVYIVGLILALMHIQRRPRGAMLAGAGLVILLLHVGAAALCIPLFIRAFRDGDSVRHLPMILSGVNLAFNLFEAAGIAALLMAIFGGAPTEPKLSTANPARP